MLTTVLALSLLFFLPFASSATVDYYITVHYRFRTVGGIQKPIVSFNDSIYGPTLRANEGDTLRVHVTNKMHSESFSMHWHGIIQKGSPWMDGVPFGSQCPILPGNSMTYTFLLDHAGTFWYHSHFDNQRNDGSFGALIVDPISHPYTFDEELILIFSDWYFDNGVTQDLKLESKPFIWVGSPNLLLLNGETNATVKLQEGKTYNLRIISAAALSWYNITFTGHNLTVVEFQGTFVEPKIVPSLWLNTGERYSVLLHANNPGCYRIGMSMLSRVGPTGGANLIYEGENCTSFEAENTTTPFDVHALVTKSNYVKPLPNPIRTINITAQQILDTTTGGILWTLNNISTKVTPTPIMYSLFYQKTSLYESSNIIPVTNGEVIDIYLTNLNRWDGNTEQHAMHIHGHTVWLLGSGLNSNTTKILNLVNPPKVDTFTLPAYGWIAVRLVADNPGAWLLHCHVSYHMKMGMFLHLIYPPSTIPPPPPNHDICGEVRSLVGPIIKTKGKKCRRH